MTSVIKQCGPYSVTMTVGHSYYVIVKGSCAESHCFNLDPGNYKITCNGKDDYTIVVEDPPPPSEKKEGDKS